MFLFYCSCIYGDYLKLFLHLESGDINEHTPWTSLLCGSLSDIPTMLYSSGPALVLEFHSGSHHGEKSSGFFGNFRFINKSKLLNYSLLISAIRKNDTYLITWTINKTNILRRN